MAMSAEPEHRDTDATNRDYMSALHVLNSRQRQRRPKAGSDAGGTSGNDSSSGTPGLRGTPGIAGMSKWLQELGYSEEDLSRLRVVHIAGTKGKGSTCAFTESFLREHGNRGGFPRKTGLYTSPHLIRPEERIRIDSQPLHPTLFAQYLFELYDRLPSLRTEFDPSKELMERGPRYLQLLALLAIHVFIREQVDVAIFETHCGGEYDATNVLPMPAVTAVTTLGMDHVDMLGPELENIAWHKAGIFKRGATTLSAPQAPTAAMVLERRSEDIGEQLEFVEHDTRLPLQASAVQPHVQQLNASLAARAAQAFLNRYASGQQLTVEDLEAGVTHYSWPGRFQTICEEGHTWFLDAAHNEMSVEVAANWFARVSTSQSPCTLIFSHINELRDSTALLKCLAEALQSNHVEIEHVIFSTYLESERDEIASPTFEPQNVGVFDATWQAVYPNSHVRHEPTIERAIAAARRLRPYGQTLITGSQHLVGPALNVLGWRSEP